jgi:hypothetical protein
MIGPAERRKQELRHVLDSRGGGFTLRRSRRAPGTFVIEANGENAAVLSGISRHAAAHYVMTLPHLEEARKPR